MEVTQKVRKSESDGLTRVISKDLALELTKLLGKWCKESELLRRIIAQSLMHSIDDFHANCSLFDINTFECPIPGWIDTWTTDEIMKNIIVDDGNNESKNENESKSNDIDSKRNINMPIIDSPQKSMKKFDKIENRKLNPFVNDKFVHETMTPIYYFILNDYAMDQYVYPYIFVSVFFCCFHFGFVLFNK